MKLIIISILALILVSCQHTVFGTSSWQYEVTGTAQTANITMTNRDGSIVQFNNVELPWSYSFSTYNITTFFASISAQNNGNDGNITVRIIRNGNQVRTSTSHGAFAVAFASYHMTSTF